MTCWKGVLKGYKLASNEDFERRTPKACTRGSWRRDEKGGLLPLEKGIFVGNCAREKKKKKKEKGEQARKGMANTVMCSEIVQISNYSNSFVLSFSKSKQQRYCQDCYARN